MAKIIKEFNYGQHKVRLETGEIAKQATASVLVDVEETIVLVTVVVSPKTVSGFLPLTVDYREKSYAAGSIPGGYFKREGRPTEEEILVSRLIDRSVRPIFEENFNHEIQLIAQVLSYNPEVSADIPALIGASAALSISGLPFNGPIASTRIGYDGEQFLMNPSSTQLEQSSLDLVVSGTKDGVLMVESGCHELSEEILLKAVLYGHEQMQTAIEAILELKKEVNKSSFEWSFVPTENIFIQEIENFIKEDLIQAYNLPEKIIRKAKIDEAYKKAEDHFAEKVEAKELSNEIIHFEISKLEEKIVRHKIAKDKKRIDGRALSDIRPISVRTSLLPRTHGSALFTRGETQALAVATLGSGRDAQLIDGLEGEIKNSFMLHYNFPPYCVGETGQFGSPKRREIGHGALATRAMLAVLPSQEQFPYVLRVVSEVMESNGSSSMATVCASSLALMDAGVPIKNPVAGIAMGLIKEGEDFSVLSDILGDEDHLGDMDFKVAGTRQGITALQMDLKIDSINQDIMTVALEQARKARLHILDIMDQERSSPRTDLSSYAPRITTMTVASDKIKDVIGKGGSTIRGLIEETGATIDIDDTGVIKISAVSEESTKLAVKRILELTAEVEVDRVYSGKVIKIVDFGAFVEVLPGREGLLHISQISNERVENVADKLSEGQMISVKVVALDRQGRIKLSMKDM